MSQKDEALMIEISVVEYQNYIACRVLLDMILDSIKNESGYADSAVLKSAKAIRELYT